MPQIHFRTEELTRLLESRGGCADMVTDRLRWLLHFAQGGSVSATCRAFNISRPRFYRWASRYDPRNLTTLEDQPKLMGLIWQHDRSPVEQSAAPLPAAPASDVCGSNTLAVEQPSPTTDAAAPSCTLCRLRKKNWRPLKRALVLTSMLVNIGLLIAMTAVALSEKPANLKAHSTPDTSVDFTLP